MNSSGVNFTNGEDYLDPTGQSEFVIRPNLKSCLGLDNLFTLMIFVPGEINGACFGR